MLVGSSSGDLLFDKMLFLGRIGSGLKTIGTTLFKWLNPQLHHSERSLFGFGLSLDCCQQSCSDDLEKVKEHHAFDFSSSYNPMVLNRELFQPQWELCLVSEDISSCHTGEGRG